MSCPYLQSWRRHDASQIGLGVAIENAVRSTVIAFTAYHARVNCHKIMMSGNTTALQGADHLVIIGNGITGITCALEVRKRVDSKITVISDEGEFFFSRPALMYIYMRQMQLKDTQPYEPSFWKKNRIDLMQSTVAKIDTAAKNLLLADGSSLRYDRLVLATGSEPNKFGWPGQDLPGVQGFYSLQDLSTLEKNSVAAKQAVIVGGGLIGVEVAEMLLARRMQVTFLVREKRFWQPVLPAEESELVGRHIAHHGVDLRLETELKTIEAADNGRVSRVTLTNGDSLDCQIVALTAGVSPNVTLARSSGVAVKRGILINRNFETNLTDVYAAGDCAEFSEPIPGRRNVEQVWYTGRAHAENLAAILCGKNSRYEPGIWFNSAKFLQLEYQVYGDVPAALPDGHQTFFWATEKGDKCLRINWRSENRAVTGIHAIGLRIRQDVCTEWIRKQATIESVIEDLAAANFDPEFFCHHENSIRSAFANATTTRRVSQ